MKLDIYTHVFPQTFFDKLEEVVEDKGPIKRWLNIPVLYDIDARLRMMDTFGDYQQVLTLSAPAIEFIAGPELSPEMARIANDGMAAICKAHPDRFPCFIASMPMNNPDAKRCLIVVPLMTRADAISRFYPTRPIGSPTGRRPRGSPAGTSMRATAGNY